MNKKVIYIGLGAVVAYLLYKKFVAAPAETKTEEAVEEPAAEEAPMGGGGGGGASASAPTPTAEGEVMPRRKNAAVKPTSVKGLAVAKPRIVGKPKVATTPTKPRLVSAPTRPSQIKPKAPAPKALVKTAKFAGFLDFDGNDDVQGSMM